MVDSRLKSLQQGFILVMGFRPFKQSFDISRQGTEQVTPPVIDGAGSSEFPVQMFE